MMHFTVIILFALSSLSIVVVIFDQRVRVYRRKMARRRRLVEPEQRFDTHPNTEVIKSRQLTTENLSRFRMETLLHGAGLNVNSYHFIIGIVVVVMLLTIGGVVLGLSIFTSIFVAVAATLTTVFVVLRYLTARKMKSLVRQLPVALDVIVRGVRVGMPLGQCFQVLASEAEEPIKSQFRRVVEALALNMSLAESTNRMAIETNSSDFEFLAAVVEIQQRSGGNISNALVNLAELLRARAMLREKVKAISMEARASAAIIGSLPIGVGLILALIAPDYVGVLWRTSVGNYVLLGCLCWMSIGVFAMRAMINFDI